MIIQDYNHQSVVKKISESYTKPDLVDILERELKSIVDISCMKDFVHGYIENMSEMLDGKLCEVRGHMLYDSDWFDEHEFKCRLLEFIRVKQIRTIYLYKVYLWNMAEDGIKMGKGKHIIAISYYATHYMVRCDKI